MLNINLLTMAKEKKAVRTSSILKRSIDTPDKGVSIHLENGEFLYDEFGKSQFVEREPVAPALAEDYSLQNVLSRKS